MQNIEYTTTPTTTTTHASYSPCLDQRFSVAPHGVRHLPRRHQPERCRQLSRGPRLIPPFPRPRRRRRLPGLLSRRGSPGAAKRWGPRARVSVGIEAVRCFGLDHPREGLRGEVLHGLQGGVEVVGGRREGSGGVYTEYLSRRAEGGRGLRA